MADSDAVILNADARQSPSSSVTSHGNHFAVVLLSGGMDSAACAVWAARAYERARVMALWIDYGQPNRDQEGVAAESIARRVGLRFVRSRAMGLVAVGRLADAAPSESGASQAFIPARNPWLLSIAANHAAVEWPGAAIDLWIGATLDDAVGFADCRAPFLNACAAMLSRALGDHVRIVAPLVQMKKRDLVSRASQDRELLEALDLSWSCYRGTACGECAPCKLRNDAFRANGLASHGDQRRGVMCGGDPHREAR